jgi:transposase InsO family protein
VLHRPIELAQYRAIRYTQRLAEADAVASVGSRGDSYDNAMAEAFNSLYKAELVRNRGPGAAPTTWNSRPLNTSTGTTTGACTANSDTSHLPSTKRYTR